MIKCIAIDMDGTLLTAAQQITPENLEAIRWAQSKGVVVVVATGRSYREASFVGMMGALKSLIKREYIKKEAVKDISFSINEGHIVGYIGPNGAGKSTTIKMLTGILVPSSGDVLVNGIVPYENRQENAKSIGVVFIQGEEADICKTV